MTIPTMMYNWDSNRGVLVPRHSRLAEQSFTSGATYRLGLVAERERSQESHNWYFKAINEAWLNLPEAIAHEYPSPEHLRKRALCETGYCTELQLRGTRLHLMHNLQEIKTKDNYAQVYIMADKLIYRTAKSQSYASMSKHEFEKSKDAVLVWLSALIGVSVDDLMRAGKAA